MDVGEGSGRPRNFPSASQSQENNIVCLASTDCKRQSAGMRSKTEKGSASFDGFFRFRNIPIREDTSESLDDVVLTDSGGRFRSAIPLQSGHEWPPLPLMKEETKKKRSNFVNLLLGRSCSTPAIRICLSCRFPPTPDLRQAKRELIADEKSRQRHRRFFLRKDKHQMCGWGPSCTSSKSVWRSLHGNSSKSNKIRSSKRMRLSK